jgi:uncharacterized damage-inducible protein DinB
VLKNSSGEDTVSAVFQWWIGDILTLRLVCGMPTSAPRHHSASATMDTLRRAARHLAWADERCREALETASPLPSDALRLYAHILAAELVWMDRVEGVAGKVAVWPEPSPAELISMSAAAHGRLSSFMDVLSPEDLARAVRYKNSDGQPFVSRLDDILLHVMLHGAYHRGQIALLLRAGGHRPAPTDYIAFVRGAAAATHPPA